MVFLSDGEPTFRLTSVAENVGRGNYVYYGTGTNDDSGFNATCALAWADALKAPVGQTVSRSVTGDNNRTVNIVQNQAGLGAKVFSVGYGVDTSDYASPDTEDVQYYYSASQAGQIANIFKLIQQTIVDSMAASNVVVRDIVTDDFDIVTPPERWLWTVRISRPASPSPSMAGPSRFPWGPSHPLKLTG